MTLRSGISLTVSGLVVLAAVALVWRRPASSSRENSEKTPGTDLLFRAEAPVPSPGLSLEEAWAATFRSGPPQSPTWQEVWAARTFGSPRQKARFLGLLEAYGFRGPEAVPNLKTMLHDPDQEIRRAALRGLGRTETGEAAGLLLSYAKDGVPIEESTEAALVLGQMADPGVTTRLQGLVGQARDPVLREHLVDALAGRPWEQTQAFFSSHLRNPNVAVEEKQNALAMLGMRDTAPAEFLTQALGDRQEEVRAGAYQGLAQRNNTAESGKVQRALERETDPEIRSLAYGAWGNQQDVQRDEILAYYRKETSPEVRLRALKAWARLYGRDSSPADSFLAEAVRSLEEVAMTDRDPGERREALIALQATQSELARQALQNISEDNSIQRIRDLARSMSLRGH